MDFKISTGTYETYIFIALSAALFVMVLFLYNAAFKKTAQKKPLVTSLKLMRILAFLFIAFLSFNPSITYQRLESEKKPFLFVFDTSASMSFLQQGLKSSRFEGALEAVINNRVIEKISENNDIEFASFASEYKAAKSIDDIKTIGLSGTTDISAALGELIRHSGAGAALIISDGRSTSDIPPQSLARYIKFPVFTLGAGAGESIKDVSIINADYPKNTYLNEAAEISVDISQSGFTGEKNIIVLKQDGETLSRTPLSLDQARRRVNIALKPSKTGLVKYELSLPALDGEITDENNKFAFYINVTEHKIRIFAIQNTPDTDFSYLLKFFAASKDIKFKFKFLKTPNEKLQFKTSDLNDGFDILILGGIDFTSLDKALAAKIEEAVSAGGPSVLFTGGPYFNITNESPVAQRFPISLSGEGFAYEPVKYRPVNGSGPAAAQINKLSPIAKINSYMWSDIPELCGINYPKNGQKPRSVTPVGFETVLLAGFKPQSAAAAIEMPVLAVRNTPGKKSAALLGSSFWFLKSGQLFSKNSNFYDRFFGNLILWLYSKEDYTAYKVETDRANYYDGERVFVSVNARNRDFSPMINPSFIVKLKRGDKTEIIQPQITLIDAGYYEFSFKAAGGGEAEIIVEALESGGKKEAMAARFIVLNSSKEMLDNTADYDCLKKISETTGAKFYEKDNIASLFADIPKRPALKTVSVTVKPFENGFFLTAILTLLCLEWAIRRYSGLE